MRGEEEERGPKEKGIVRYHVINDGLPLHNSTSCTSSAYTLTHLHSALLTPDHSLETHISMKSFIALMALPLALAASLKSVVVTFPKGTPDSVITQAKHSLVASVRSASQQVGS